MNRRTSPEAFGRPAISGGRYVHGYAPGEQRRLIAQAEFWRDSLILDGTVLADGTRLLEIGCGVGAGLAILGIAFPRVQLAGVDIEPGQIAAAPEHLAGAAWRLISGLLTGGSCPMRTDRSITSG
jgi:SAM-dependent methyltransferase